MIRLKTVTPGLLALALLGVAACGPGERSSSDSSYTVLVDLYSGRDSPQVDLSSQAADELYGELDGRADEFSDSSEPAPALGFRGFVVTPTAESRPVLRVTKESVYAVRGDKHELLADPEGRYYRLILDDVSGELTPDVLSALP
jgi:hypothetical protein